MIFHFTINKSNMNKNNIYPTVATVICIYIVVEDDTEVADSALYNLYKIDDFYIFYEYR